MNEPKSKADISRERVLDAAARIFREKGYADTTMREIAKHAGVEAGSIYYHFRSKDELISAVISGDIERFLSAVTGALAALPPNAGSRERIETAIHAHLAAIVHYGDYSLSVRRILHQVPPAIRRRHTELRDEYRALWQKLLDGVGTARPGVNRNIARLFLLGALTWTAEWYDPERKSPEAIAAEFSRLFLDGFLAHEEDAEAGRKVKATNT